MNGGTGMFKRYELHNHTLESDASQSCSELTEAMERDGADVFAVTDHNTVSGHGKVRSLLEETPHRVRAIYGMEYTTYYGHIICPVLNSYVGWENINRHRPELLFSACREAGASVGIAHPFAFGDPLARGCRFEMNISDFSCVDYIEIINNQESMTEVNLPAIRWWEALVLEGKHLAACAGMDLHRDSGFAMKYATYVEGTEGGDPEDELKEALRTGRTWVSNGIALICEKQSDGLWRLRTEDLKKPGFIPGGRYVTVLKASGGEKEYEIPDGGLTLSKEEFPRGNIIIPELFSDEVLPEKLVCVSPVIRL